MSRPRFLANHDLTEAIILGVTRREPAIDFKRLRDVGLASKRDSEVLEYAAGSGLILISHDVNTMTAHARARLTSGERTPGVFLAHQSDPVALIIEDLILVWAASEAEEWAGRIIFLPIR
jgi:hypothetical protein